MSISFDLKNWGEPEISDDFEMFLGCLHIDGVHEIQKHENPYHILIQDLSLSDEYILVGLHGALERSKITPPAFFFRGVAVKSGIGLIAISDPSISLSKKLHLGWYLGNNINKNITKDLASLLDGIVEKTGKKLILCGGSGGGFAALNIHNHMRLASQAISFVWNPQIDITKYSQHAVKTYFNVCVEENPEADINYIETTLLNKNIPFKVEQRGDLDQLIFINGYDHAHLRKQVRDYINNLDGNNFRVFVGNWGYGHIQPPQETIINVIRSIAEDKNLDETIDLIPKPEKPVLDFNLNLELLDKVMDCRASIIRINPKRLICIKTNIYDHFIGFQSRIVVKNKIDKVVFRSNYLVGANICELYINSSIENIRKLKGATVEIHVEDIKGEKKMYDFSFDKIKELHDCAHKI